VTELPLLIDGMPYWTDDSEHKAVLCESELKINIDLCQGEYSATAWGCDLTHEYINKGGNYRKLQKMEKQLPIYLHGGVA
jgi:N-acetylglutamate synthase/N-acetylornithine aminotransferase